MRFPRWQRRSLPFIGRLLLELLVVFVGVFGAATLAQSQAERAEREHAHTLRRALAAELAFIHAQGRAIDLTGLANYADAITRGDRPPLNPFISRVPFSPDVWNATLSSGLVRLMDPALVLRLANFYGRLHAFLYELDDHRANTRALLLPKAGHPPDTFYDEAGRLRIEFRWYLEHLRWLGREAPHLTEEAGALHQLLQAGIES